MVVRDDLTDRYATAVCDMQLALKVFLIQKMELAILSLCGAFCDFCFSLIGHLGKEQKS